VFCFFLNAATDCFVTFNEFWVTKTDNIVLTFSCTMADADLYSNMTVKLNVIWILV
jgi:hypothetical protein